MEYIKYIIKWIINELLAVLSILLFILFTIIFNTSISIETNLLLMVIIFFGSWIIFNQLDMMEKI